ncbi:MAG: hypothetical protein ACR2PI_17410 [Hyphomicrobiaceae bacterium]
MRRVNQIFDVAVIFGMTLAGYYQVSMIVIIVGVGALAAGPIARSCATARARPHVDTRQILRSIRIDAALYGAAAAISAYLLGRLVALLWGL